MDWRSWFEAVAVFVLAVWAAVRAAMLSSRSRSRCPFLLRAWKVVYLCASSLALSTGYCTCLQKLWRFRGWSKSRTSKAQLGADFQTTVGNERMGSEPFRYSLMSYEHTAQTAFWLFLYFDINAACCLFAEMIKHAGVQVLKLDVKCLGQHLCYHPLLTLTDPLFAQDFCLVSAKQSRSVVGGTNRTTLCCLVLSSSRCWGTLHTDLIPSDHERSREH